MRQVVGTRDAAYFRSLVKDGILLRILDAIDKRIMNAPSCTFTGPIHGSNNIPYTLSLEDVSIVKSPCRINL